MSCFAVPLSLRTILIVNSSVSSVKNSVLCMATLGVCLITSIAFDSILSWICSLAKNLIGLIIPLAAAVPSAESNPVKVQPVLKISLRVSASYIN